MKKELLENLFEPVGLKPRNIMVDYRDKTGRDRNQEFTAIHLTEDASLFPAVMEFCKENGYTLTGIHEFLNGHTNESLKSLPFSEAKKHVKMFYLNRKLIR